MNTTRMLIGSRASIGAGLLWRAASPRLTLCGFVALGVVTAATQFDGRVSGVWLVLPLGVLWLNLLAAMTTLQALRCGGLGVFHAALAVSLALIALGRLLHFDGRVEVTQGGVLDGTAIEITSSGPWHGTAWQALHFEQGPITVDYAPGLKRAQTISDVVLPGGRAHRVGDSVPLVVDGYHFYTTHNKGFAPLIVFSAPNSPSQRGALHLPSYPLFDWKQEQTWHAPQGPVFRFWLRPDAPLNDASAWRFDPAQIRATLVVEVEGRRAELRAGESIEGAFGRLRFERLVGWMGYRISRDATLVPLFWCALIGVMGLAWHLVSARARRRWPRSEEAA